MLVKALVYGIIVSSLREVSIYGLPQNDWIPISKGEVLSEFRRYNRRYPEKLSDVFADVKIDNILKEHKMNTPTKNTLNEREAEKNFMKNVIKVVQPMKMINFNQNNEFHPIDPDTITSVNDLESGLIANTTQDQQTPPEEDSKLENINKSDENNGTQRKPKALTLSRSANKIADDVHIDLTESATENEKIGQVANQEHRKTYQVTEDAVETLQEEHSNIEELTGYFYIPPQLDRSNLNGNNLTNLFLDILSKHHIRPDDNLPNYSLSRRERNRNLFNGYMLIPIPLRDFPQFNNLDPLAVLLSNYGYYLPGSYGIRGKYRNLYSYLATNNIHNNKPFGSYKIFSDTDSSN